MAAPREKLPRVAVIGMTTLAPGAALAEPTCKTAVFGSGVLVEVRVEVGVGVNVLLPVEVGVGVKATVPVGVKVGVEVRVKVPVAVGVKVIVPGSPITMLPSRAATGMGVPEESAKVIETACKILLAPRPPTA